MVQELTGAKLRALDVGEEIDALPLLSLVTDVPVKFVVSGIMDDEVGYSIEFDILYFDIKISHIVAWDVDGTVEWEGCL